MGQTMATTMNISLPDPLKEYVKERVRGGEYSTPSDYVRELIRAERRQHKQGQLENLLREGLQSGEPIEASNMDWEGMEQKALTLAALRKPK